MTRTEIGLRKLVLGRAWRVGLFRIQNEDVGVTPIIAVPAFIVRHPNVLPERFIAIILVVAAANQSVCCDIAVA